MRVLIALGGFYPAQTYGGPTVSIDNLCTLLSNEIDFYILTSDHELNKKERLVGIEEGWNDRGNCKVKYLRTEEDKFKSYEKIVDLVNPDVIYINSLFSAKKTIPFLFIAKKKSIPLLLAPRGELCVNAFNKKYKKIPYLLAFWLYFHAGNVWYQSTSNEETAQLKKIMRINDDRIFNLTNVPAISKGKKRILKKNKGQCSLTFISRIQEKKNLKYALEVLREVKGEVELDIYGPKESISYWNECEKLIYTMPKNVRVKYCGQLEHEEVNEKFSQYHGFLFPTLSENYGHVLVEAMSEGCLVITSDQVPWTDVNDWRAGWSIPLKNKLAYIEAVETLAMMGQQEFIDMSRRCTEYISQKTNLLSLYQGYLGCFEKLIKSVNT